jgi:uncharacterized membrane protein
MPRRLLLPLFLLTLLGGCDMLGLESATQIAEKRAAEGKAVGGACRHAGRAIEDCYTLNRRTDKAAIYAGWREMDDYMRENKLSPVAPQLTPSEGKPKVADAGDEAATEDPAKADKADKATKPEKAAKPAHGDKAAGHAAEKAPAKPAAAAEEKSTEAAAKADVPASH